MCSLHLTHPSVDTWSSGQLTVQRPGSSHGLPVGAGIRTHNLGLPRVSSPTLYPLGQRLAEMNDAVGCLLSRVTNPVKCSVKSPLCGASPRSSATGGLSWQSAQSEEEATLCIRQSKLCCHYDNHTRR